jgi:hypothetical protein
VRLDQRYVTLDGYSRTWVRPLISRTSFPSASGVPAPVASLYAADATHLDIAAGRPKQGRDRIALGLASFFSGFPDARWTVSASATGGREDALGDAPMLSIVEENNEGILVRGCKATDERLQTIVEAATRHLHAFVREVGLTHSEWDAGIRFLTAVGQTCTPERQEMVLLSDVLGVSSQMELTSAPSHEEATANTVLGTFYIPNSPWRDEGASILESADPGQRVTMHGCSATRQDSR